MRDNTMSNNRATIYRPLSIGGTVEISSSSNVRYRYRRQILAISLCLLCTIIPALLVAKELFHLSVPNLLRTIFGTSSGRTGSSSTVCLSNELFMNSSSRIDVMSLGLNYTASSFTKTLTNNVVKDHEILSSGFYWDHNDAETTKFRPQGVTTYHEPTNGDRFVLVSWYGRKDEGYSDRGGRVSFVNISGMNMHDHNNETTTSSSSSSEYFYTHVLLVDMNGCTLDNIHVGGIEQQNGTLYVADSRKGQQAILEFDIGSNLYQLPADMNVLGYRYVLRQSSSFNSPIKPSFVSYDIDLDKFVIGTYARCGKKVGTHVDTEECFTQPKNRIVWFDKHEDKNVNQTNSSDTISNETDSCNWHYFSEMQGAVSASVGNGTIIWISSSYGPIADSHLHVVNASSSFIGECPQMDFALDEIPIFQFPPGLEDLHIEQTTNERLMWMVTEFGTRRVFATHLDALLP